MIRKTSLSIISALAAIGFAACNSSSSSDEDYLVRSASTMVTGFSLADDDKVAVNLDSVFFTIDVVNSRIFNADSLPYGTNVSRIVPKITTDNASVVELYFKQTNDRDTVVNYLENSTDTINFSRGPVRLRIVSQDGLAEQTYQVSVNVHQIKSDSLVWTRVAHANLPSIFAVPADQCTAKAAENIYCLTRSDNRYCIAVTEDPGLDDWRMAEVTFPFTPNVATLRGGDNALYILDNQGALYASTDEGASWQSCSQTWHYIYGSYGNMVLGSQHRSDGWHVVSYPAGLDTPVGENFPVSGTSLPIEYTFEMASSPQMLITGGRLPSGGLTGDTWGFDGKNWAKLSRVPIPQQIENLAVVPYFSFALNAKLWKVDKYSTLFAFGGNTADGVPNSTVYTSRDFGMTWVKADKLLQMPANVPAMTMSQAFVVNSTLTDQSRSTRWTELTMRRVSRPIDSWECPYIYIFGGKNINGQLYNTVWRGVISRLTFKPIQ